MHTGGVVRVKTIQNTLPFPLYMPKDLAVILTISATFSNYLNDEKTNELATTTMITHKDGLTKG